MLSIVRQPPLEIVTFLATIFFMALRIKNNEERTEKEIDAFLGYIMVISAYVTAMLVMWTSEVPVHVINFVRISSFVIVCILAIRELIIKRREKKQNKKE
ncbi:MAG: hypothetical protein FWE44_03190 [Defluviitaleaceae bacterium]|nr:hypothetical protein [Defluviitaleaceae bacterium]